MQKTYGNEIGGTEMVAPKWSHRKDVIPKYQRRPSSKFEAEMSKIFDITKSDGEWLWEEEKKLYQNPVKFSSSIGYITNKKAPLSTIYTLKRKLLKKPFSESCEPSTTIIVEAPVYDSSDG